MTATQLAVEARELTKRFGDLVAVDGIDLDVHQGEVFGFLGPNGAGKTTTISMLTTLLEPSSGTATVGGHDIITDDAAVRSSIGIVFQEQALDERLTARENLDFHAVLYHIPRSERPKRIDDALALVDLSDRADDLVERFSGGMRRRLEITRGLLHTPRILFLDEPTLGLDPQTRRSIWDHIRRLRDTTGVTIFLTTHYMEEAEFCDRIAIMDHAKIVALDTPDGLKHRVGGDVVTMATDDISGLMAHLDQRGLSPERHNGVVRVEVADGTRFVPSLARDYPGTLESMELRRPTLDDVFLKLTGRSIRDSGLEKDDVARGRMRQRQMMRRRR